MNKQDWCECNPDAQPCPYRLTIKINSGLTEPPLNPINCGLMKVPYIDCF